MKKIFMLAVISLCLFALSQSCLAQGTPEAVSESFPAGIAFFEPIQFPSSSTGVGLFRLNLIYGYNNKVSGLDLGIVNRADEMSGLQIGAINFVGACSGVQIGIFNYAYKMKGLQLGIMNMIDSDKRTLVIANFGWYIE